ncbi:alpha/beta hydrolase [Thalassovita taeanensis]|uniref:Acetyl esterase/lipase n=1 Tax=Thalassovita taeanensis TaxID=657014 RepID=A0A1H9DDS0_9RHOB|nr:alpha/beta hydrolase [Thalassovita taeanensis]SEQ11604.1 Acetyl esterase/lipase [Thalassovita taeanensis]
MSLRRPVLNLVLRLTEKPYLARVQDPEKARAGFEGKARLWFRAPRGTTTTQVMLGSVPALRVEALQAGDPGVVLYFHGGAYVFGSPRTHRGMLAHLSRMTGLPAILPYYRLAPENPFPKALDDALSSYRALLASVPPEQIVLGGDSAGGGLVLALVAALRQAGAPLPRAAFALSPFTDMSFSGASIQRNARCEVMLPTSRLTELRDMYLQGADPKDPRASPLFGDFNGSGPVLLTVSDAEILEDDSLRMADVLRAQGVHVDLLHRGGLPHVWPMFQRLLPEADRDLAEIARWVKDQLSLHSSR